MKNGLLLVCLLFGLTVFSQNGTIKGKITDKLSEKPLQGVIIVLVNSENNTSETDENGNFTLQNVPIGRQVIEISFAGYENSSVPNIDVTSGKDVFLTIALTEKFNQLEEVVIKSDNNKAKAINKMAAVSTRQFSVEEVNRYAGGRSDVARLVANFAGVSTGNDSRNDIVVRGNSPAGMLWRIEGIPVPSPNHFSTLGTTGSPVSALNPNMLANSDFLTSAFPAEYGNAISGVFDLSFRKGNKDNYEFTAGIGAYPGVEFVSEGPMGKNQGSFLVAGRYGIAGYLGGSGTGAAIPNYNDVSFHLDFGKTKLGNFTLFGIAGFSNIEFLGKDATDEDLFSAKDANQKLNSDFYSVGLTHKVATGNNSFLKTTIGTSNSLNSYEEDRLFDIGTPTENKIRYTESDNQENRITVSSLFNSKINRNFTIRTGVLFELFNIDFNLQDRFKQTDANADGFEDFNTIYQTKGHYTILQPYAQAQIRLSEKLTLNAGLHGQSFSVNNQFVLEPRTSVTYKVNSNNTINLGYGLHHQNVPAPILFQNENIGGNLVQTNKNLDLVRSNHFVLGYDVKLADKWRGKAELYYQNINNAGVENFASSYSTLTEGSDFGYSTDKTSLVSNGKGKNIGIELTIEKFFSKGYHALVTTSFFESKYEGSDGIERNSPFNNKYTINALGGKEFKVGKSKRTILSFDGKITTSGGRFYSPIDLVASQNAGFQVNDDANAYSKQYDAYFRLDLRTGIKFNSKKRKQSHIFYCEIQNVTDNDNIFVSRYNRLTNQVNRIDQIGLFPDFGYKFQF
ncbi:TonB-dependent receptor [Flavobacterium dankookense]|uniref:Outer membrane receptor protein involved in Fe transport n=1 Tax=Flavobacterium dankookense TaxID=706186 RepID=A0A4R6QGG5_9FLAO|nr:TonB-dependent receptor [Flavobacterium dankookense]TDP61053.1 outer membrane receptor protein involved in Fe transport [Flavobacterium dankookense]